MQPGQQLDPDSISNICALLPAWRTRTFSRKGTGPASNGGSRRALAGLSRPIGCGVTVTSDCHSALRAPASRTQPPISDSLMTFTFCDFTNPFGRNFDFRLVGAHAQTRPPGYPRPASP